MMTCTSSRRLFRAAAPYGRSLRPALHVKYFSATPSKSSSKLPSAAAVSFACALILLSDPISSAISDEKYDGVNDSYWANELQQEVGIQKESVAAVSFTGSRLRNEHKFHGDFRALPSQARIVIVGGGFAGLHTALALAEKMSSLKNSTNIHDDSSATLPPLPYNQAQSRWRFDSSYRWLKRLFNKSSIFNIDNPSRDNTFSTDIIVLEANKIGTGSSGRAKGLVVPGFQVPLEDLEEGAIDNDNEDIHWTVPSLLNKFNNSDQPRYTKEIVQELYKMSYIAMDRLKSIVDLYEIDCDWVESGAVEGSIHPMKDEEEEEEESDGCCILSGDEVNNLMGRTPSHDISDSKTNVYNLYQWGEYDPGCAGVNPLKLTIGLANAVERWGVKIYEGTKLVKLTKTNDMAKESSKECNRKYTLTTEGGNTIQCDHVVLCTGAHALSSNISSRMEHSFVPIYTWMAATEPLHDQCPLQDRVDDENKNRPAPMCGDDHISLNYWRNNNKDDRRLLFGSLADTFVLPEWLISLRLRSALKEVYPKLENVRFEHIWGGKLAFAPNSMPVIGRDTDYDDDAPEDAIHSSKNESSGVWYATGFAGHGIVPTALAGTVLANAILEIPGQQQWQLFHTYFPPSSFNGYPYSQFGAGVVLSIYNIWDWAGKKGIPLPALPKLW